MEKTLSLLLDMHEINFEKNWRYRTLSKLETLFHVTNVTTVLNVTVATDRVSRFMYVYICIYIYVYKYTWIYIVIYVYVRI